MSQEIKEALESIYEGKGSAFTEQVDAILKEKARAMIEARRIEIASNWLEEQDDEDEEEDDEEEMKKRKAKDDEDEDDDEEEDDEDEAEEGKKYKKETYKRKK